MKIHEILIENQLNEEILTELDWSKIKKGLATGAITLGALGISGNAMAQHFKVDNASKIKDSQVMKYVQNKVDTGEIKPAVVKQAVQKVDAAPEVKKDEPKKAAPDAAPEVKSKAAEPKQDIKPEIKKDEPKKTAPEISPKTTNDPKPEVKKDEPKKAAPDELDIVKKNAGIDATTGSFSIKGLSFGMTLDQVLSVTQAKVDDNDSYYQARNDHLNKTKSFIGGPKPSDFKKSATKWDDAFKGFTIAGITGRYGWEAQINSEKQLAGLKNVARSEQVEEALDIFTKQYGTPKLNRFKSKTKGGLELDDFTAQWQVKDAVITMYKHIDRDTGVIKIQSKSQWEEENKRDTEQRNKASKDF
jgi:hypothetical protein